MPTAKLGIKLPRYVAICCDIFSVFLSSLMASILTSLAEIPFLWQNHSKNVIWVRLNRDFSLLTVSHAPTFSAKFSVNESHFHVGFYPTDYTNQDITHILRS